MNAPSGPASWLFVKNDQSIWVVRPLAYTMIVSGPGRSGARHEFTNETEVESFQAALAERLTEAGWILHGVGRDRRTRPERRATTREVSGRRRNDPSGPLQRPSASAET